MPKVKMSDIKSGSEKVKAIFRRPMSSRNSRLLKEPLSNKELIEILDISEDIEHSKDSRSFYQKLILNQEGPFNPTVFRAYMGNLFHVESLVNLLERSQGVDDNDKSKWIEYAILTNSFWFIPNYFANGKSTAFGIDIFKSPFNFNFAGAVARYKHKMSRGPIPEDFKNLLWKVLDSMSDENKHKWYLNDVSHTYEDSAVAFLTLYPNTPAMTLKHYYNRETTRIQSKEKLVMHPNCPPELRTEMYELTNNEKFLPQEVQDIFLF